LAANDLRNGARAPVVQNSLILAKYEHFAPPAQKPRAEFAAASDGCPPIRAALSVVRHSTNGGVQSWCSY
jgi:hypothetical protein